MRRIRHAPRPSWTSKVERELGFVFHSPGGRPYWDETAHFEFGADQIEHLYELGNRLYAMCLEACDHVVTHGLYPTLGIPEHAAEAVGWSWSRFKQGLGELPVYGRFDIAWDGRLPSKGGVGAKLIEFNASTPTSLYETAVVQWHWLQEYAAEKDQFNGMDEALVDRWHAIRASLPPGSGIHFTAQGNAEDLGTIDYMRVLALKAGIPGKCIPIQEVGYDKRDGHFYDFAQSHIDVLWSLYPPEWLIQDEFGQPLLDAIMAGRVILMEPLWKLMLTKGILAVLWELHPHHPNLLKCSVTPTDFQAGARVVAKPLWGREGDGVQIATVGADGRPEGPVLTTEREAFAGAEGHVYQEFTPLPDCGGGHVILGLWMVGEEAKGLGIREDMHPITGNASRYVPHLFHPESER